MSISRKNRSYYHLLINFERIIINQFIWQKDQEVNVKKEEQTEV